MEYHFCDKCGRKITEDELDSGDALMMGEEFYCSKCKDSALTEMAGASTERAASPVSGVKPATRRKSGLRGAAGHRTTGPRRAVRRSSGTRPAVGRRTSGPRPAVGVRKSGPRAAVGGPGSGRPSDRLRAAPPQSGGSNTPVIIAGAVAAAAIGAVVAFVFLGGDGEEGGRKPRPRGREKPAAAVEAPEPERVPQAPVVAAQPVGVPENAKSANDFASADSTGYPGENTFKLITGETSFEVQAARASRGWRVLRSPDAKCKGEKGFRVVPEPRQGAKGSTENQVAIVVSRPADLSEHKKLGLWIGGKNVDRNLVKVTMVVGDEETSLTGTTPLAYGTQWKFYSFDLVGKRDDVRGLILHFNAAEPPTPANFEFWIDEVIAYGGDNAPAETEVAERPAEPTETQRSPVVRPPGPRRPQPPVEVEPETPSTQPPPPRRRPPAPAVEEPKTEPTQQKPPPPVSLPPTSGNFEVVWRETFDKADKPLGFSGEPEKTMTYEGSAGARGGKYNPESTYNASSVGFAFWRMPGNKRYGDYIFIAGDDVYISLYYYVKGVDKITVYGNNSRLKTNLHNDIKNVVQGKWTPVVLKTMDFANRWDKAQKTEKGDKFGEMSFAVGKPKDENAKIYIDNFTITKGGAPRDIELQLARSNALTADQTGDPAKDGFYLMPNVIANLKQSFKADKVKKGIVLKVGGDSATSMFHIGSIKGITAVKRLMICGKMKGAADITEKFPKELASQKPEVVTIMFGIGDLAKNRQAMEVRAHYITLIEKTLEAGAIPVLFTLPLPVTGNKDMDKQIGEYNKAISSLGREKNVPVIDAHAMLTKDIDKIGKHFAAGFKLKKGGHEVLNAAFKDLYDKLSKHVAGAD